MTEQLDIENDFDSEVENDSNAAILEAFTEATGSDLDEDAVKMRMIQAGATFKNVTRLYNQFMVDAGLAISKQDRDQIVSEILEGKELTDEETFDSCVKEILEQVKNSTERSAAALIRAYAKKNELEVFSKPKSDGVGRPSFVHGYHDFLVNNPRCTEEQATAFVMGTDGHAETSDNVKKRLSVYLNQWRLVGRIADIYQAKAA